MTTVTLYGRPGCHLCEEALEVVRRVQAAHPFALVEIDIETDDELLKRHLERIPVIAVDGEQLFEFFVDEISLVSALQSQAR